MSTPHLDTPTPRSRSEAPRFAFSRPVETPAEQFANWLPYSAYLAAEKIFVNRDSMGFLLELMPQSGADERMAEVLVSLYANCQTGTGIQFHLFASPQVREPLRRYANLRVEDATQAEQAKAGAARPATATCSGSSPASVSATCCRARRPRSRRASTTRSGTSA